MKFTVVGAGALGTIIGAHLAESGYAVSLVARGARAQFLRRSGMRVEGLRSLSVPAEVVEDLSAIESTDALIFAVKTYQMEAAIAGVAHVRAGAVLSVANGVMKNEQLADVFGPGTVLGAMADTSGELRSNGIVEFTRNVGLTIGPYATGAEADAALVAGVINGAGVVTRAVDDIASVEWSKLVAWVAMFSLAVISRQPTGRYLSDPWMARAAVRQIREAGEIAARLGVTLTDDAPMPVVSIIQQSEDSAVDMVREAGRAFVANAPTHRMSALQDLEAGRTLEVHGTVGYLVGKAAMLGIAVPNLTLCLELCAGINDLQISSDEHSGSLS